MRCKEHFQGDRCRKDILHESEVAMKPDPVHVGQFTVWEGSGDKQRKVMQSQAPILKRHRGLERFMRNREQYTLRDRKQVIEQLNAYANYQRINKKSVAERAAAEAEPRLLRP